MREDSVSETKVLVPFRKDVDLTNPKEWIAIDINEGSVTAISTGLHVLKIESSLRTVHTAYFGIRKGVRRLSKHKPLSARRLLKKYSGS